MAALAMGAVAIACRRNRSRAFWLGFSVLGWEHMILALAPWFDDHTGELILTRQLLDMLGHALGHDVTEPGAMSGILYNMSWASTGDGYTYLTYLVSGQSLFTLLIAMAGGFVAQCLYAKGIDSDG